MMLRMFELFKNVDLGNLLINLCFFFIGCKHTKFEQLNTG